MRNELNIVCSACRVIQAPEVFAIKLSKKYIGDLCSKLILVGVLGNRSRFINCFQLK